MVKKDKLDKLYKRYKDENGDKEVVTGEGNPDSKILLIGEAPGKEEVKLSKPFVGTAGKNLNEFLEIIAIDRDTIYITNAIKYRLSKVNEKTGRLTNRPATREEIEADRKYLAEEINIIKPLYIVTLGNVPLRAVTNDFSISIGAVHGQKHPVKIDNFETSIFPLYHPASIIYNRSLKETYVNDVKKLKTLLSASTH